MATVHAVIEFYYPPLKQPVVLDHIEGVYATPELARAAMFSLSREVSKAPRGGRLVNMFVSDDDDAPPWSEVVITD